jgi:MFS family permease
VSGPLVRLGLISLVFNLGGGLVAPALPLYARSLGADYRDLGLIGAAHGVAFAALTIPLGRASDRFGRRRLLLVSALVIAIAAACYLASTRVAGLVVGKLLEAGGWAAFWPALEAWVAEEFGRRAGSAMGVGYGAYAAAFMVGTSAGGFVIEAAGLRVPFALYLVMAALSVVLVLLMPGGRAAEPHAAAPAGPAPGHRERAGDRSIRALAYGTGFIYVFGLGAVLSFLPAYAVDRGLDARAVGLLLGSYWVARVLGSLGAGRLSDRWGRAAVLVPAMAVSTVAALLVAAPMGAFALAAGTVGLGLASGACGPTCVGLVADHVAPANRGVAMGLFEASCGLSFIVSGFVGGHVAEAWDPAAPYLLAAVLSASWAVVLARQLPRRGVALPA